MSAGRTRRGSRRGGPALALAALSVLAACTTASPTGPAAGPATTPGTARTAIDTHTTGTIHLDAAASDPSCDPIAPRHCLLPYPDDFYTVADPATATGRRLHFERAALPANTKGVHVDPADWNRADGFSPGTPILAFGGPVDLAASGAAPITDLGASVRAESPVVVLDATLGSLVPHWVELDAQATSDQNRLVVIHPAVSLPEGHRIVVGIRRLVTRTDVAGGAQPVAPSDAFRAYRDRLDSGIPAVEQRRAHFEDVFAVLGARGIGRSDLQLAWDFTVASTRDRSERVLHMRDDALAQLGDRAPAFMVTKVENDLDDRVARRVTGTFEVPSYLTGDSTAGTTLDLGPDGLPRRNPEPLTMPFECIIPRAALDPTTTAPARVSLYGHGLLGTEGEVHAGNVRDLAQEHDIVFCATRWIGMSEEDIVTVAGVLTDFSAFPTIPDRLQQGFVGLAVLGRLLTRSDGVLSDPAFQREGRPVYDPDALFYDGNSQGGVVGGGAVAVSPDIRRAVLGVPGMDFSLLLPRSKDFVQFAPLLRSSYPDELEQALLLGLAQVLWDRGETDGYAQHLGDHPLPGTPAKAVLLHVAYGDFQVAPVSAEIEARTIGARIHRPAVADGRSPDTEPYWGIEAIPTDGRYTGSALVIWDSGAPTPPVTPVPPTTGADPHEHPRNSPAARTQKSEFLRADGAFVDVCDARPCTAAAKG